MCCCTFCQRQARWTQFWGDGRKNRHHQLSGTSQVYKYLGVDESNGIQHSTMRETLQREYFHRVKMMMRTELYSWNKILAINGFALPVLTYGLVSFIRGLQTCSSFIDGPGNFSLCKVSIILQQLLTGCTLCAPTAVECYNR